MFSPFKSVYGVHLDKIDLRIETEQPACEAEKRFIPVFVSHQGRYIRGLKIEAAYYLHDGAFQCGVRSDLDYDDGFCTARVESLRHGLGEADWGL